MSKILETPMQAPFLSAIFRCDCKVTWLQHSSNGAEEGEGGGKDERKENIPKVFQRFWF